MSGRVPFPSLFFFFFSSSSTTRCFVGGTLCSWRKERGAARQIDLPESSFGTESIIIAPRSRCLSFRSPSSLSLCRWIDNDRSWAERKYANRPDWIILWSRSYRPENIEVEPGRVKNFLVSTRFFERWSFNEDHLYQVIDLIDKIVYIKFNEQIEFDR